MNPDPLHVHLLEARSFDAEDIARIYAPYFAGERFRMLRRRAVLSAVLVFLLGLSLGYAVGRGSAERDAAMTPSSGAAALRGAPEASTGASTSAPRERPGAPLSGGRAERQTTDPVRTYGLACCAEVRPDSEVKPRVGGAPLPDGGLAARSDEQFVRASVSGTASWHATGRSGPFAAACGAYRTVEGWRGSQVTVRGPVGELRVTVNDYCANATRLLDLSDEAFLAVCGALSRGLCVVTVS